MPAGNFGVIGTKHIDFKPIVDEAYLRGLSTASGLELTDLVRLTDQAMQNVNGEINEVLAQFISITSEPEMGRRRIGRKYVQKGGEYTTARSQKLTSTSYMLPIDKYEIGLGFTEDGLHEISLEAFNDELQAMVDAFGSLYLGEMLLAFFDPTPVSIARGSDIKSPRFAGSGTGDYAFTGSYPDGSDLPGGYTHYFRDTDANLGILLRTMVARIRKWHPAPYDLLATANVIDRITASTDLGFVSTAEMGVTVAQGQAVAQLDPDVYVGQLPGRIRVRQPLEALGSGMHFAIAKSYGAFNAANPLRWLYDPKWGRDAYIRAKDDFPLAESVAIQRFGIGVGDRAGAVIGQVAPSGAYTPPVITF
jgi:hypothetical protein